MSEPRLIPLRRKYMVGKRWGYAGGENAVPKKHRTKLSDIQKRSLPPQPLVTLVVDGRTGAGVFRKTGEFRTR